MRVLVTGSAGFVGQHLLADLRRRPGMDPVAGVRRHVQIGAPDTLALGTIGIDSPPSLAGFDSVVHCAARVHVMKDSAVDPLAEFRRINVAGSVALAERAAKDGVRRFVFLSSVKVNGEKTDLGRPFAPEDHPAPVDAYGISKHEAEIALRGVADRTGMELVVIRPVLVYGPGVKGNFKTLLHWLDKGIPLPLAGIDNRRSIVSVTNLCDLVTTCLTHRNAPGRLFFASDSTSLSTPNLLEILAGHLDRPARLFALPSVLSRFAAQCVGRKAQHERLFGTLEVNIEENKEHMGWQPVQTSEIALRDTALWFKANNRH